MSTFITPDRAADRIAARQHGAIALEQALGCGLSRAQVRYRVEQGRWRRATRAAFVVAGAPRTWLQAAMVACLAGPAGTQASHLTTSALLGLWSPPPLPHITVPPTASARMRVAKIHRSPIDPIDRTRINGIPCSTPSRMLVECAELLPPEPLAELVDATLVRGLTTPARVIDAIERSGRHPGRRGTLALREALAIWAPGIEPGSPAELKLVRRVVEWGFPPPELQVVVRDEAGRFVARLDAGWPARKIGLEYDGRRHHGPRRLEPDESRHARLRALGWRVGHVEKSDLLPGETTVRDWLERVLGRAA
jgi:hypothetical protein